MFCYAVIIVHFFSLFMKELHSCLSTLAGQAVYLFMYCFKHLTFWSTVTLLTPSASGLLAVKSKQWPGLGRIHACLSCWPQFFHAVINSADNTALRALFLSTSSTLPHILMAWHRPLPQSPLCLRYSTLPGSGLQLVHILVKHSANQTITLDLCVLPCRSEDFLKCSWIYVITHRLLLYLQL